MKNYAGSFLLISVFAIFLHAQPLKNDYLLGGSILFQHSNGSIKDYGIKSNGESKLNELSVSPKLSYYVSDHFVIALSAGYSYSYINNIYSDTSKTSYDSEVNLFFLQPSLKQIFYTDQYISFFGEFSIGYGWGDGIDNLFHGAASYPYKNESYDIGRFVLTINPGVNFYLSKRLLVDASIGILYLTKTTVEIKNSSTINNPTVDDTDAGVVFNFSKINLGVHLVL